MLSSFGWTLLKKALIFQTVSGLKSQTVISNDPELLRWYMKKILIGVMPQDKIRQRVIAVARGERTPKSDEPKIWFPSIKSAAEILTGPPNRLRQLLSDLHE